MIMTPTTSMLSILPQLRTHAITLSTVACLGGCDVGQVDAPMSQDSHQRSATMATNTLSIDIALPAEFARERVEAVARAVEAETGVAGVKVKVKQVPDGQGSMYLELWGNQLPEPTTVVDKLKLQFPELATSKILVEINEGGPADDDLAGALHEPDSALAEQEIVDRLRAQGVQGNIEVKVSDEGDGQHRRVEVEVHEEQK